MNFSINGNKTQLSYNNLDSVILTVNYFSYNNASSISSYINLVLLPNIFIY